MDLAARDRIDAWLDERKGEATRLQSAAMIIGQNGCLMQVHGWGSMMYGGPFGRMGLDQGDALNLIELSGMLGGICMVDPELGDHIERRIKGEMQRVIAEFEKQFPPQLQAAGT